MALQFAGRRVNFRPGFFTDDTSDPITVAANSSVSIFPAPGNAGAAACKVLAPADADVDNDLIVDGAAVTIDGTQDSFTKICGPAQFVIVRANAADAFYIFS